MTPCDELIIDIMGAVLSQKIAVYTCNIKYGTGVVAHPSNTTAAPLKHIVGLLLNTSMSVHVAINKLPESNLTSK